MKKRVLLICTDDFGGAGIATYELMQALNKNGYSAKMLVKNKTIDDGNIICFEYGIKDFFFRLLKRIKKNFKTDPNYYFFNVDEREGYIKPELILDKIKLKPDIIIGTWISRFTNFKTISDLAILTNANAYVATTDMSALTGGCHYSWDCKGYINNCKNCPAIVDSSDKDRAHKNLKLKITSTHKGKIKVLAGSAWTAAQVKESALFSNQLEVPVFAGLIDSEVFNGKSRDVAKIVFHIPEYKKVIFVGAINGNERRKGFQEFKDALRHLHGQLNDKSRNDILVVTAGKSIQGIENFPFNIKHISFIKDERLLSLLYQAANVFVCPSIEDSGPQMTLQAMACGTPVVSFNVGFGLDIVKSDFNGYSVPVSDSKKLAIAIGKVLFANNHIYSTLSVNAQKTIEEVASLSALNAVFQKL